MSHRYDQQAAISADLWPGDDWEPEDLRDLLAMLSPFGETGGQRSYRMRGTGLQVTLAFVTGAVASGFFGALGEHLYSQLAKRIEEFLKRPQNRRPEWSTVAQRDGLFFVVQDHQLRLDLHLYGWLRNHDEVREFLLVAPRAYSTIVQAVQNGRSPCIRGKAHAIHVTWCESGLREWDISITVREGDDPHSGTCLLGLEAFVPSEKLTASDWQFIQWMDRASAHARREKCRNAQT